MEFGTKKGFFGRLQERITDAILLRPQVDESTLEELEEILITSDIGMDTSLHIVEKLREAVRTERIKDPGAVQTRIQEIVKELVDKGDRNKMSVDYPLVVLMIGVNGGGKTTSIAKMAALYKNEGKSVLLAAADTFRAAAADQLAIWAGRVGVDIIKHGEGADPSAVIYDSLQAAKARGTDVLICDTAGRLQNKKNLMNELEKMNKVIDREFPEAARETLLVLDATTGKNAVSQAQEFGAVADITGIVLTKMDGTAKGGIAITISDEFDLPIKFLGVGERIRDLTVFDPSAFAASIFEREDAEEDAGGDAPESLARQGEEPAEDGYGPDADGVYPDGAQI
ncbi:MAG: signal recognition particle-docking protein FtsY [Clostridiales Family XIII bacterium]|jgi:fused signal recognition particle receptor|nr:signal recognition particle-docking protein FtsY [Clostridiales Family XIII bacterium]